MKILLQQKDTNLYLQSPGIWVERSQDAFDFPSSCQAILFRNAHQLSDIRMIFKFEKDGYAIRIPLEGKTPQAA